VDEPLVAGLRLATDARPVVLADAIVDLNREAAALATFAAVKPVLARSLDMEPFAGLDIDVPRLAFAHSTAQASHGPALHQPAVSATNHCLTGCVIGEVTGMFIATALGWGDVASIGLAVGLAYVFGFTLTARPLVRAGLAAGTVVLPRQPLAHRPRQGPRPPPRVPPSLNRPPSISTQTP
jgi:hypothetical protein